MTDLEARVFKLEADLERLAAKVELMKTIVIEMTQAQGQLTEVIIQKCLIQ